MTASDPAIPGLGSAKPGDVLPASNFAPATLATAVRTDVAPEEEAMATNSAGDGPTAEAKAGQLTETGGPGPEDMSRAPDQLPRDAHVLSTDHDMTDAHDNAHLHNSAAEAETTGTPVPTRDSPPASPDVTHALEAALDGLLETTTASTDTGGTGGQVGDNGIAAEWEEDSSPYQSGSDSSDDSTSSEGDSDEEVSPLSIEETARMLMEAEAGSDDEGDGTGAKGARLASQVRTKHEQEELPDEKPDITITPDEEVCLLGTVAHIVEETQVVVNAQPDAPDPPVLDSGSVLCREDRTVIGVVHDTIATVHRPMYVLLFRSAQDVETAGVVKGMAVWYPKRHAKYVFPAQLRQQKGSDASNLHDEEVGPEEMEFSDDEQEQAHKREKKEKRGKRRGGKGRAPGEQRGHPLRQEMTYRNGAAEGQLDYDENEDGPYRPLSRPSTFGQGLPPHPPPPAGATVPQGNIRSGPFRGRRGDFRGRGGRGQGFGGRGRGGTAGYSQPPQPNSASHPGAPPHTAPSPGFPAQASQWTGAAGFPLPPPPPPAAASPAFGAAPPALPPANFNFQMMQGWNPPFPFQAPSHAPHQNWLGQALPGAGGFGYPQYYGGNPVQGQMGPQQYQGQQHQQHPGQQQPPPQPPQPPHWG